MPRDEEVIFMRKHETKGARALSVAIAMVFVIAAFAIMANDDISAPSAENDTRLGSGTTYFVGDGEDYANLDELADHGPALVDGDTIQLTSDIDCYDQLEINGISITLDLNGFDLTFDFGSNFYKLMVLDDGDLVLNGNGGKVYFVGTNSLGIYLFDSAATISADIISEGHIGIEANKSNVTLNGNITAAGGIDAYNGSEVTLNGNILADGILSAGIYADGSKVTVNGDVTLIGTGEGVAVWENGEVTINGKLTVIGDGSTYIYLCYYDDDEEVDVKSFLGEDDNVTPTTKAGYLTYTNGLSTVWILAEGDDGPGTGGGDGGTGDGSGSDDDDGSMDTWMIALIAIAVIGAIGAVVYFFVLKRP